MTRTPVLCAALALLVAPGASQLAGAQAQPTPARSSYWRERTSFFRTFGRRAEVVMVGDSLTDGAEWAEMFPDQDIVNRGIDSDTSDGVLERIGDIVAAQPRVAFLMIGINDFTDSGRSVDAVFANYRAIVSRLVQGGARVVVQSTLPCNEAKAAWKSCASLNPRIAQLDARLPTLAAPAVTYVDLRPLLAANGNLKPEVTVDGVHLTGDGYRLWKQGIAASMPAGRKLPRPR
jgi:hexosaminidase